MPALNIRNVSEELARQVRMEAAAADVHVREWVILVLERACGFAGEAAREDVINGRLELFRQAVGVGWRSGVRSKVKGKGRSGQAAPERVLVEPGLEDGRNSGEETNGALQQFTASGSLRCQHHDDTGWQCRLADGHGNNCM